jgi:Na+-transporting NADH:ubiquinone oxidoreductase subunit NqrB
MIQSGFQRLAPLSFGHLSLAWLTDRDPRDYQLLFLSSFLVLGIATRDWTLRPGAIAAAIIAALLVQAFCEDWLRPDSSNQPDQPDQPRSLNWRSPLITALGLSLLLRVDHWAVMAAAAAVAIGSKFVLKVEGKHLFNPANFGIVMAIGSGHGWLSPGQWGEEVWLGLLFLGAGGLVLRRVGRWDTTIAFLGCYFGLELSRNLWLGWTTDVLVHRLSNGSLLLFALFMVTDPRSIPNARGARLLWAMTIAGLTFWLRNSFYLPTAVIWALAIASPLTLLFDRVWVADRFVWSRWIGPTNLPVKSTP